MRQAYLFSIPLLIALVLFAAVVDAAYRPVISGKLENGNRLYTEPVAEEEFVDRYFYSKYWLRYRQQLATSEYYYLKAQYYRKEYEEQTTYNNLTLDLWGNYTYRLNDKTRNRWVINLKNKDYQLNSNKSYNAYRVKYELIYDYNSRNRYSFDVRRQWNVYQRRKASNSIQDRFTITWSHEVNDRLEIDTTYRMERELFNSASESTNKYGNKVSLGFSYEL